MATIKRFGQRVKIEVLSTGGNVLFTTESLRIDFDIRTLPDFTRARFDIFNLAPNTIKKLTTSECFISLYTALHDEEYKLLADRLYVSNAYEQTLVPDSVTSFFCYSKLKYEVLETNIDIKIANPSFSNSTKAVLQAGKFSGVIDYVSFPAGFVDAMPPKTLSNEKGSVESILKKLCKYSGVNMYPEGDNIKFVYRVDSNNSASTDFHSGASPVVVLDTNNMRGQPEVGVASLRLSANLSTNIYAGVIVDTHKLLTAAAGVPEETLEIASGLLQDKVAQNTRFQVLQVQHKGSSWTKDWTTSAVAYAPSSGTHMNTYNWFQ